ncbi:putative transmembrane protein [Diplonema papillatum]|nr:putative transmembrane protein [Diplonema papillatum]
MTNVYGKRRAKQELDDTGYESDEEWEWPGIPVSYQFAFFVVLLLPFLLLVYYLAFDDFAPFWRDVYVLLRVFGVDNNSNATETPLVLG